MGCALGGDQGHRFAGELDAADEPVEHVLERTWDAVGVFGRGDEQTLVLGDFLGVRRGRTEEAFRHPGRD